MIEDCKFFTMFGVNDDPTDHMKCLLFKTCDPLEACDDCITGPELPLIDLDNCTIPDGNFTAKLLWTMWLMFTILMMQTPSLAKTNVQFWMIAIGGPFLMFQPHQPTKLITNAFCLKIVPFMSLVLHVKQDPKLKKKHLFHIIKLTLKILLELTLF